MIDITPDTDENTQVTEGDKVRLPWLLNAQVSPADVEIIVKTGSAEDTYSASDLTEQKETIDGSTWWRYYVDVELKGPFTQVEYRLDDSVNKARDTAQITAERKIT